MIRIDRTQRAPEILREAGRKKTTVHRRSFMRNEAAYRSGQLQFDFDASIYAAREVKSVLSAMQHGKCAFCESKVTHISYGDVEHFRPKAAYRKSATAKLTKPGYFWLAYSWDNLFFTCELCNRRHKASLFPLIREAGRAHLHNNDVTAESPMFINPAEEDPEALIAFDGAGVPYAIANDVRANITIKSLGLDRPELNIRRLQYLEILMALRDLIAVLPGTSEAISAEQILRRSLSDSAEFAAMARQALPEYR